MFSRLATATAGQFPSVLMVYAHEWLDQAMRSMRTRMELVKDKENITVEGHKGYYPVGMISIDAMEYKGERLRKGSDITCLTDQTTRYHKAGNRKQTSFYIGTRKGASWKGDDIVPSSREGHGTEYYVPYATLFHTSFEEGTVSMHFSKVECDKDGFPLVPDNNDYLQACVYYMIMMAVQSGAYQHGVPYSEIYRLYDMHMTRAIGAIRYPSPDKMYASYLSRVNLVPRVDDFNQFNIL